jgi:hypothetical protein
VPADRTTRTYLPVAERETRRRDQIGHDRKAVAVAQGMLRVQQITPFSCVASNSTRIPICSRDWRARGGSHRIVPRVAVEHLDFMQTAPRPYRTASRSLGLFGAPVGFKIQKSRQADFADMRSSPAR